VPSKVSHYLKVVGRKRILKRQRIPDKSSVIPLCKELYGTGNLSERFDRGDFRNP
jgi:hypothetical protein